jgi:hypothetical protein
MNQNSPNVTSFVNFRTPFRTVKFVGNAETLQAVPTQALKLRQHDRDIEAKFSEFHVQF